MGFKWVSVGAALFSAVSETVWSLIAQVTGSGLADFPFGSITASGVLCWYAYHTTAKTIPGLITNWQEEQREERTVFAEQLERERQHHAAQIALLEARLRDLGNSIHALALAQKEKLNA